MGAAGLPLRRVGTRGHRPQQRHGHADRLGRGIRRIVQGRIPPQAHHQNLPLGCGGIRRNRFHGVGGAAPRRIGRQSRGLPERRRGRVGPHFWGRRIALAQAAFGRIHAGGCLPGFQPDGVPALAGAKTASHRAAHRQLGWRLGPHRVLHARGHTVAEWRHGWRYALPFGLRQFCLLPEVRGFHFQDGAGGDAGVRDHGPAPRQCRLGALRCGTLRHGFGNAPERY